MYVRTSLQEFMASFLGGTYTTVADEEAHYSPKRLSRNGLLRLNRCLDSKLTADCCEMESQVKSVGIIAGIQLLHSDMNAKNYITYEAKLCFCHQQQRLRVISIISGLRLPLFSLAFESEGYPLIPGFEVHSMVG